ncbi:PKD domain-containing protein [Solirubrobacter sp. CPCC 204708]|uniref:PKD domain-containing protein n=1 Tax=Solirubrobacter deserti TaxID=2282478 RepID=A0ABT4RJA9_9ACTN|nr:PKD domain-containing protein [Solirubrobacter deserti]MBE2317690.1 PKD domain-containing protein [Solirubrobacter deserti]MDA0138641.1 PKD domain-containing protein [Solirubrobacter deserti]
MIHRGHLGVPGRRAVLWCATLAALLATMLLPALAGAQESKRVLLYTGTTGFRHTDAIDNGRQPVQNAIQAAGYTVDWENCVGNGGAANNCDNPDKNPRIFTDENLAKYDAIVLLNSSAGPPGPLWSDAQKAAIIKYVQNGGGIAGVHNATDMGTTVETWDWWDGNNGNSVVGATMRGHAITDRNNVGQIQVADKNHLATRDLPDTYGFGDEHYNFRRNVRGSHHVLTTIDESTYTPGGNGMGQDHPLTWCKLYDGDAINDNTTIPGSNPPQPNLKAYNDGRTWVTSMGHFGASYTENGGNNNLIKTIVGGVRWVAGEGKKSDCAGTVWSSYTREVVVADANNPIGIDVAKDGKVYWSEIGNPIGMESTGYIKMHDPTKPANNKTTVASIPTRADHGNSEDGVLGMALQPGFDLSDPNKRHLFVYYSPRNAAWPTSGNAMVVGYNQISRFTLTEDGTAVVPGSERKILEVPKAKISGSPAGFPGGPSDSGPGHVGGAGMDFDSAGNLYLGIGDDVSPNAGGHDRYAPMDFRAKERWDARKTSQNSADLRGKIIRIAPKLGDIPVDATPGVDTTYGIPTGNLFPVGTAKARPEIYAMGFRQPFTLHTDPKNPGIVGTGEYCHDNGTPNATRSPAGTCEWNLLNKAGNHGWPLCVGDNSAANSMFKWNYATSTSTGERYDCNGSTVSSDIRWAPTGQTPVEPTFDGLDTLPGPVEKATVWKNYPGTQPAAFGNLASGGMQPVAGPIYRYDAATAGQGAFPAYYDGSWFINNRGDSGFWKEVKMRADNNQMLRVQDWLPWNGGVNPNNANSGFVIGTQFGPDGNLYMARYSVGCCRSETNAAQQNQIVKISFNVQDECLTDTNAPNTSATVTGQAYPDRPNTYVNSAKLRLAATDSGCAGVKNIEYREVGASEWQPYSNEVTFEEGKTYNIEFRATDRKDNVATVKTTTFEILKINDTTAPVVTAATAGNKDQRDFFVGSATLTLTATDNEVGGSGVQTVEYRTNGGAWTAYTAPVAFNAAGNYTVDYRATDKVNNTSEVKSATFRILAGAGCTPGRSDEFDGSALSSQWLRHTRNGGTPETGAFAPTLANGKLTLPTHNFELDSNSTTTAVGPVNFIGQDLASLGTNWTVETQLTVQFTGGWQHTGLIVHNGDNNFFRATITHDLNQGRSFVEQSKDNPSSTEGARVQAGGSVGIVTDQSQPVTIRMRYMRVDGSNTVQAHYRVIAPASAANPDWVAFPGAATFNDLNPTSGARRDAAGSRIGIIAGGNFPGTAGTHPYNGTPANVVVDYFRVSPDPVTCETAAPVTTATLDPAAPATGDTYDRAVKVNFSAADSGASASGVEKTEYRLITNGVAGQWTTKENSGSENPFANQLTVSSSGTNVVEFRSTDKAANTEETKSVTFKVQLPVCDRSDEFDGTEILPRWIRHTRNGGTPTTGPLAPTVSDGQLHLPTNDLEIDNSTNPTSFGPINFLGQDLPSLGTDWSVETQFTAQYRGGWQNIGLAVWNGDNNFIRSTLTHSLSNSSIYVESSKDNPAASNGTPSPEGVRATAGGNRNILATNTGPVTIKMRFRRVDGANTIQAHYQVVAPASAANADWVAFPGNASFWDLNPANGPRRDATGSRIGLIAQDNWPAGGTFPSNGQPAIAHVDYFRVTPDNCPTGADTTAPTTTATAAPAAPNGSAGWYTSDVNVTLAGNDGANGSGIERTEYKVNGGAFAPYTAPIALTTTGTHTIEFRSIDKNNNTEATKTATYKVDKAAPTSTATLQPATTPSTGPVTLTLAGEDQAAGSGLAKLEFQVNNASVFGALTASAEWVTYDAANKPTFSAPGLYSVDYRATDAAGNVEAAKTIAFTITAPNNDKTAPVTSQSLDPAQPGAGKTYSGPVTVKFSALDPLPAGPAGKTVAVTAAGDRWAPDAISLVSGDTVRWDFPADGHFPHDVWLVAPGGDWANPTKESEWVNPGGPSVTKTLNTVGTYTFICKVHAFPDPNEGRWIGMVGTATVTAAPAGEQPSGVDYTEYRVKTGETQGDWVRANNTGTANPFASQVTVEAEGQHTVEFRSVDKAGNAETAKSVAFGIDIPEPGTPVIEAFADPTSGKAPLVSRFSASGYDPDGGELSYKWEFTDGPTVLGPIVTRTFTQAGTYTVKVTATDDEGDKSSKELTVTVSGTGGNPPTVDATADRTTAVAPALVAFTATGTGEGLRYSWEFGDGERSVNPTPEHVYLEPGDYTARVTVTDKYGATATKTVTIKITAPAANLAPAWTTDGTPVGHVGFNGDPMQVQFTAEAKDPNKDTVSYEWDFDDDSAKSTKQSPVHTYTQPGTYDVTVKVTDGKGGELTKTIQVTVARKANTLPEVTIEADPKQGPGPLTVRFSSQISDADGDGWKSAWNFGDGSGSAEDHPTHVYNAPGVYTATLTITDAQGGVTTKSVQITVTAVQGGGTQSAPKTNAAAPAPEQAAWFGVGEPVRTSVSAFAKSGLSVKVTATEAMSGTAKLVVTKKVAKALGLKSTTLASAKVSFTGAGSKAVKFTASKAVKRALAKAKGSVKVTLSVSLKASGEAAKNSSRSVTLTK